MDEKIDYTKVASSVSKRFGQALADTVFELEQWKNLAESALAERNELKTERDSLRDELSGLRGGVQES